MKHPGLLRKIIRLSGPLLVLGLLIALVLWRGEGVNPSGKPGEVVSGAGEVFESNSSPNTPLLTAIDPAGAGRGGRPGLLPPAPAQVDPVFRRLGEPTPVRPFPRGANQERRFAGVTTRELNEAALLADPVVLAMSPADGRVDLLPEEIDKHTKAARRMVLDTKALDAIAEGRAGRMKVPLPDGTAVDLVFHRVRDRGGMTRTLEGEVEGEPQKTVAQFVYHDGIVHGSVARYDVDRHFEYRILSTGFLMVTELDLESMTDNCGGSPPPPAADIVHAAEGPDGEESAGEGFFFKLSG